MATLTERWFFNTGDYPVTASTTVVNGVAYVGDWSSEMHALDVRTGAELWNFQIDDAQNSYPGHIVSSAVVDTIRVGAASIRVLVFGGGATLYALNPVDGTPLAKQDLDPRASSRTRRLRNCAARWTVGFAGSDGASLTRLGTPLIVPTPGVRVAEVRLII